MEYALTTKAKGTPPLSRKNTKNRTYGQGVAQCCDAALSVLQRKLKMAAWPSHRQGTSFTPLSGPSVLSMIGVLDVKGFVCQLR